MIQQQWCNIMWMFIQWFHSIWIINSLADYFDWIFGKYFSICWTWIVTIFNSNSATVFPAIKIQWTQISAAGHDCHLCLLFGENYWIVGTARVFRFQYQMSFEQSGKDTNMCMKHFDQILLNFLLVLLAKHFKICSSIFVPWKTISETSDLSTITNDSYAIIIFMIIIIIF